MKLHELIEASEPKDGRIETMFMSKEVVANWVDRESYDKLKAVAIELAKAIEFYGDKDRYEEDGSISLGAFHTLRKDFGEIARLDIAKCRGILEK